MQRPIVGGRQPAQRRLPDRLVLVGQTDPRAGGLDPQLGFFRQLFRAHERDILQGSTLVVVGIGEQQRGQIPLCMPQSHGPFVRSHLVGNAEARNEVARNADRDLGGRVLVGKHRLDDRRDLFARELVQHESRDTVGIDQGLQPFAKG